MTPDKLRFARLILAAALLGAPLSAMAQTTDADPASADAPAAAAASSAIPAIGARRFRSMSATSAFSGET